MKKSHYRFAPSFGITLLTLVLLPLLISLGFWQLHRAVFKEQLLRQYAARLAAVPTPLAIALKQPDTAYLPVTIKGKPDVEHIILLDNKIYQHQPGYQVIIPVKLPKNNGVLVNWGWIPQGPSRNQLPAFQLPLNVNTITGIISPPQKNFLLGTNAEPSRILWPLRLQQVNIDFISQKLGYRIAPFVVLLSPKDAFGYVRNWVPIALKPHVHRGYAFQWFALAILLVILFLISSIQKMPHEKS